MAIIYGNQFSQKKNWTQHSFLFSLSFVYELVCICLDIAVTIMENSSQKLGLFAVAPIVRLALVIYLNQHYRNYYKIVINYQPWP